MPSCPGDIPRDKYIVTYKGICYQFVLERIRTFRDAERACEVNGGTLVIINDEETNSFIVSKVLEYNQADSKPVWIGMTRAQHEGTFIWVDGSYPKYTNWSPDRGLNLVEPVGKDCVSLNIQRGGEWTARKCDDVWRHDQFGYICQYRAIVSTTPPTETQTPELPTTTEIISGFQLASLCPSDISGNRYVAVHNGRCYQFVLDRYSTFINAETECEAHGGSLAVIKDAETNVFIEEQLQTFLR